MGSFSLWHWLIVLLFIGVPIGVAYVAVRLNRGDARLKRSEFALRVIGIFVAGIVFSMVSDAIPLVGVLAALIMIAAWYLVPYWAVNRLRDIGDEKKAKAVWIGVPFAGLIYTIILMFKQSAASVSSTGE